MVVGIASRKIVLTRSTASIYQTEKQREDNVRKVGAIRPQFRTTIGVYNERNVPTAAAAKKIEKIMSVVDGCLSDRSFTVFTYSY